MPLASSTMGKGTHMVPIDQLLKKNFWIAILPLIGIAALLNAQAVTQLVGISLGPDEKTLATPPPVGRVAAPAGSARNLSAEPILSRNPFDHVTGSLKPAPVDDSAGAPAGPLDTSDPWNAPKCDGVKVLIIAASSDPDWSFATFGGDKTVMLRRGGELSGKKVHFVGWDRVWLENGGTLCQANLFEKVGAAAPAAPAPAASASAPPSGGGAKPIDPGLKSGIKKTGPNEWDIDRATVDKILENQADLMRQARIVPEQENGRVVGIRLFGVRPDTLLGTLGMQNGDRLQTINGFEMGSPEKALEAYARLRTADKLQISLNRNGANMNLDYNIK